MNLTTNTVKLEAVGSTLRRIFPVLSIAILCFSLLTGCINDSFDQNWTSLPLNAIGAIRERGELRVVTRGDESAEDSESSLEAELARAFGEHLGVDVRIIAVASPGEVYSALDHGIADIAAATLSQTTDRSGSYRYTTPHLAVSQQVIFKHGSERPRSIEDLIGKRVMVLSDSRAADLLRAQQSTRPALSWSESTRFDTFELLRQVASAEIDYAIIKSTDYFLNEGLFPGVEAAFDINSVEQRSWVVRNDKKRDELYTELQSFLSDFERSGELALLHERLVGYVPEFNRIAVRAFARRAQQKLPRLEPIMKRVAADENIDWHLLAAISYQESHWNPDAVSRTGVKGMMMLTEVTASEVGVDDRTDMIQSLRGGARYFRRLLQQLPDSIQEPDRTLFALAAYNMGSGHVNDARDLAEMRGFDPDRWSDVEQQLPLLTRREWYKHTRHGYARGFEATSFVRNIRQYHRFLVHRTDADDPFQLALTEAKSKARS